MQIRKVPELVESLASMLHTVWQTWLATILENGGVPPETRIIIPSTIVYRWRKLASVTYDSLTYVEKDPYRHLAEELEGALAKEYIIIPLADYEKKIQAEVVIRIGNIHPDLLDCLVYARGEALGKNQALVQKAARCIAYFSLVTNPGQRVSPLKANKKEAI